jgi:hypothetical protein
VTIELDERPDRIPDVFCLFRRPAVFPEVPISKLEVLNEQLVDGKVRGMGSVTEASGEILRQEPPALGLALLGPEPTQIEILSVDRDDSSARCFVMAE